MPPQQAYGLLDFVDHRFDLGTHAATPVVHEEWEVSTIRSEPRLEQVRRSFSREVRAHFVQRASPGGGQKSPPAPCTIACSASGEMTAGGEDAISSLPMIE